MKPDTPADDPCLPSPFLQNAWYLAGWVQDFPSQDFHILSLLGNPILLFRLSAGGWAALEDVCCHRLVPLSLGRREEDCVRCMYHGLKFSAEGHCVEIPGQQRISSAIRVRAYPVEEKHGGIWLWMGEPERADAGIIPPIAGTDDGQWAIGCSSIAIDGSADLIWDNLLDLTHVPFVHANSFAGGDPAVIAAMIQGETQNMKLTVHERGVKSTKWHLAKPRHPFLGSVPCDDLLISDFIAPGVLIITVKSYPAGSHARHGDDVPNEELLSVRVACQVVTPITATSSRIFFNIGTWASASDHVPALLQTAEVALMEDKIFIDAQQATMRTLPHRKAMALSMDVAVVRFHQVMKRLRDADGTRMPTQTPTKNKAPVESPCPG